MGVCEQSKELIAMVDRQEWDAAVSLLAEDFLFLGPDQEEVGAGTWLAFHQALCRAVPDLRYSVLEATEANGHVHVRAQAAGTHTGPLDLPMGKLPKLPPTGLYIELPPVSLRIDWRDGKVSRIEAPDLLKGGVMGMMASFVFGQKKPS